ncbi:amidohydrolase [Frankia sp. CNm7]|uniref:Amidohydrolase n=1 Tax=Frankia nepalensis TaxID=1836974 RepID=A0A937RWR2_9ACTN|nr:amidohydrolase family protein [Frankia nepalensis]MBL7498679.1 amidohydrolase [Frankia nepalensis]MBL7509156.1 amidohydrolase [Frankia nepalensis]MBL7518776.1 amidohydrolase [Frankia nepalensis]MBL7633236.1 amidohydrolase [Frankia nepalensis]
MEFDFEPIDADNHYYEPLDAFTRHLDRAFKERGVKVVTEGRRTHLLIGGKVNRFIPNPTFDPIIVPGCLDSLFRGQIPDGVDPRSLMAVEPLRSEYQNRDDRAALAERQGLDAILLFPTLGCGVEEALKHDVDATMASLSAFNKWLEDDWGYVYRHRLVSAPMISLADPAAAVAEIDRVLDRGARIVHVRPAPVPGEHGTSRSLGDRAHDPVWARLAEASIPVAFHLGDSGYNAFTAAWGGTSTFQGFGKVSSLSKILVSDRAIHDTVASLVVDGVFTRFPGLRVASIENGSDWVSLLVRRLRKQANQTPWDFPEDPLEVVRRNVWVTPYYEEDIQALAELVGVERILFGSDWPHGEGLAEPTDFVKELHGFDDAAVRRIMRDNALELLGVESL